MAAQGPSGRWTSLFRSPSGPSAMAAVPTVVVLGMTGDGKSNLATWLLGNPDLFPVSDKSESCTEEPVAQTGHCFGGLAHYRGSWQIVDTPGLSDSAGRDAQNLRKTVALLKEQVKQVNAFILVVNAQQDRMSSALKNTIKVFRGCFGPRLWSNLCVVFTKWDWEKRLGGFTATKLHQRRAEWRQWFQQCEAEYNGAHQVVDSAEIQFFGVDIPSLALVEEELGPDEVVEILNKTSKDGISSTGQQLRLLYNQLYVVLGAKAPVSMQLAEAQTEHLHEEIVQRLKEEKAQQAKKEQEHQRQLQEERAKREAEQKEAKAREDSLARQAKEREERMALETRQLEERLRREAREREEEQRRETERVRREVQAAQARAIEAEQRARAAYLSSASSYCGSSYSCSQRSHSPPQSHHSAKMSWNEFQHSLKGQGFSSSERSTMYQDYKRR